MGKSDRQLHDPPYNKEPTRVPAKPCFSPRYNEYEICGAFGLLDQGPSGESDIVQERASGDDEAIRGEIRDKGRGVQLRS